MELWFACMDSNEFVFVFCIWTIVMFLVGWSAREADSLVCDVVARIRNKEGKP